MTDDRVTLKWPSDVYEPHNEERKDRGLSWPEYARRLEFVDERTTDDSTDVLDDVSEGDLARAVAASIDYNHIADRVSEKVVDQLRR